MIEFVFSRDSHFNELNEAGRGFLSQLYKIIDYCDVISLELPTVFEAAEKYVIKKEGRIVTEDKILNNLLKAVIEKNKKFYCIEREPSPDLSSDLKNFVNDVNEDIRTFFISKISEKASYDSIYNELFGFFERFKKIIRARDVNAMNHAKNLEQNLREKYSDLPENIRFGVLVGAWHSLDRRIFNKYFKQYDFKFFLPFSGVKEYDEFLCSQIISSVLFFNENIPAEAKTIEPNVHLLFMMYDVFLKDGADLFQNKVYSSIFAEQFAFFKKNSNRIIDFEKFNAQLLNVTPSKLRLAGLIFKEHTKDMMKFYANNCREVKGEVCFILTDKSKLIKEALELQNKVLKKYGLK